MATNAFKVKSGVLNLTPLASAPSAPEIGDVYLNLTGDLFSYNGSLWEQIGASGSGTFTPVLSSLTNNSSPTAQPGQWIRVGNVVTFSGQFSTTETTSGASTQIRLTLPQTENNFTSSVQASGSGATVRAGGVAGGAAPVYIESVGGAQTVNFIWTAGGSAQAVVVSYTVVFQIL
jgi:hypothetical protein